MHFSKEKKVRSLTCVSNFHEFLFFFVFLGVQRLVENKLLYSPEPPHRSRLAFSHLAGYSTTRSFFAKRVAKRLFNPYLSQLSQLPASPLIANLFSFSATFYPSRHTSLHSKANFCPRFYRELLLLSSFHFPQSLVRFLFSRAVGRIAFV